MNNLATMATEPFKRLAWQTVDLYLAAFLIASGFQMAEPIVSPNGRYIFVFSDDLEWARSNLVSELPMDFVDSGNGPCANLADLELISSCRHHIIANSSFSWWGAWRGNYVEQRVIAPGRWFADASTDTRNVVPARWNKI